MSDSIYNYIGVTAPYSPVVEELEGDFPVKVSRYSKADAPAEEEAIVALKKLHCKHSELYAMATHCEA